MTRAACRLVLVVPQNRTSTGWHGNYRKNAYFMALTGSLEPDRDIVLDSFRELGSLPGVRCVEIETLLTETARRHYGRAARARYRSRRRSREAHPAEVARELVLKHQPLRHRRRSRLVRSKAVGRSARGHSGLPARHEGG